MNTIKVRPNQSMLDVILQGCGSLEGGMQMMADNTKSVSDYPDVNDVLTVLGAASALGNGATLQYFKQNGIVIGTLGHVDSVGFTIVLKPVMRVAPNIVSPPSVTGYYSFDLLGAPGFINVNPLAGAYLTANPVSYITEERYAAGDMPDITNEFSVSTPSAKDIPYQIPWVAFRGFMMIWNASDLYNTATFADTDGNQAYISPVILLDNITQNVEEYLVADMHVELVSATYNTATLRLTRSHAPVAHSDFVDQEMSWLGDATGGSPDPADPTNPDKTIVALPRGRYTFGVATLYINGAITYPPSSFTEVVIIA